MILHDTHHPPPTQSPCTTTTFSLPLSLLFVFFSLLLLFFFNLYLYSIKAMVCPSVLSINPSIYQCFLPICEHGDCLFACLLVHQPPPNRPPLNSHSPSSILWFPSRGVDFQAFAHFLHATAIVFPTSHVHTLKRHSARLGRTDSA